MKHSVIVIGAGAAGIGAARMLQDRGQEVIIIEARDRIGGRVYTSHQWEGCPVDMGASWIHGKKKNPLSRLAKNDAIKRSPTDYNNNILFKTDGTEANEEFEDTYEKSIKRLLKQIRKRATDCDSILSSLQQLDEWKTLAREERQTLIHFLNVVVEHELAGALREISALNPDDAEEFSGKDLLMHGGYDLIFRVMSNDLNIKLNQPVQRIQYYSTGVSAMTNQAEWSADRLILTVPIGVLKNNTIDFDPPLPTSKQQAIAAIGSGSLEKLYLKFPEVFWDQDVEFINWISEEHGRWNEWLNLTYYTGEPILLGFNAADYARKVTTLNEEEIVDDAMQVLRHLYGKKIPQPTAWQTSNWLNDSFALGSYSFNAIGANKQTRKALFDNIEERLYFAGEATSVDYPATVHGAYLSGIEVAHLILNK
jgi:monoamine oxidase